MRSIKLASCLCAALALGVAACGGSEGSDGARAGRDIHVAIITPSTTQNAFQEMTIGAKAAAAREGVTLRSAAPPAVNGPQEVQLFQAALGAAKDGVATMTTTPDLFARPFAQAIARGVPQISIDTPPPAASGVETFVGNDNVALGATLARAILSAIPVSARGEVVLGNPVPGLPVLDLRIAGMRKVLRAERPAVRLVGPFNTGVEPTQNFNAWNAIVKAHPRALAYLDPGDQAVVSLARIEQRTGRRLVVGGADVDPAALQALRDGRVRALVDPRHWLKGYIAIALLVRRARDGTPLPKGWWDPGGALVTRANVDAVLRRQASPAAREAAFRATVRAQLADPDDHVKPLPAGP